MRLRWWHAVRLASVLLYAVFHMPSRPGKRKAPPSSGHGRALMSRGDDVGAGHVPVLFGPPTFDLDGAASNSEDASGSADHQSPDIDSIGGSSTTPDDPSLHGLVLLDGSMVVPSAVDPVGLVNSLVAIPNSQFHWRASRSSASRSSSTTRPRAARRRRRGGVDETASQHGFRPQWNRGNGAGVREARVGGMQRRRSAHGREVWACSTASEPNQRVHDTSVRVHTRTASSTL